MESLSDNRQSVQYPEQPGITAAVCVDLWTYGGSPGKLRELPWRSEGAVAELFAKVVAEHEGKIIEGSQNKLLIYFDNPMRALSAAKSLQLTLLTFDQGPFAGRVVINVAVNRWFAPRKLQPAGEDAPTEVVESKQFFREEGPPEVPRILVTEEICKLAKGTAGFEFSASPRRRAGENGASEPMHELLWADATSYTRLRQEIQEAGKTVITQSRYLIDSELGRGAMGVVYKAHDKVIDRTVALKTILVDHNAPNRDELLERLLREAKAAGSLDHSNIITIYDVGQEGDLVYLSMQFVEGETLGQILAEANRPPLNILLSYIDQICNAVGFAHKRGVVHRDLKPANLMLTADGLIKVLDFGIAKLGDASMTQAGMVVGTPSYMAPEQASGKPVDHRSDIFSLGAVFYELITGERAFGSQGITTVLYKVIHEDPIPPSAVLPSLPRGLDAIVQKALAKNPEQRFQSCEEMRQAFREHAEATAAVSVRKSVPAPVAPLGTQLRPEPEPRPISHRKSVLDTDTIRPSRRWMWMGLAVCLIAGAAIAGAWFVRSRSLAPQHSNSQPVQVKNDSAAAAGALSTPPSSTEPSGAKPDSATPGTNGNQASHIGQEPGQGQESVPATNDTHPPGAATIRPVSEPQSTPDSANATPGNRGKAQNAQDDSTRAGARKKPVRPAAAEQPPVPNVVESVDGFSRSDIPDLQRKADADAGRGDYIKARYEYGLILRLDRQYGPAREGLRRVQEAEKAKAQN